MDSSLNKPQRILILGAGNFGTCLAQHLARHDHNILLWSRSSQITEHINTKHKNPKYLSTITLSNNIKATDNISADDWKSAHALLLTIPTQSLREVLESFKTQIPKNMLIICAAKGIEQKTLKLPTDIIRDILGTDAARKCVFLSGPSFAEEIIRGQPTAVCVASKDDASAREAQKIFHSSYFRTYTSNDPVGLEICGALKNVIAIAAGVCAGLGYEQNAQAALLTRGLAELTRIGVALGAHPLTFVGLSGVGDLFLTCSSPKSRNYSVGFRLGKGEKLDHIIGTMGSVAEGVATAKAAYELSQKLKINTPIINEVYQALYQGKDIKKAVTSLLSRDAKNELDEEIINASD